jgi:hypothetical protein
VQSGRQAAFGFREFPAPSSQSSPGSMRPFPQLANTNTVTGAEEELTDCVDALVFAILDMLSDDCEWAAGKSGVDEFSGIQRTQGNAPVTQMDCWAVQNASPPLAHSVPLQTPPTTALLEL